MRINHIYEGDCLDILASKFEHESIDMIYADPPYNASGKSLNLINNNTGGSFYKINEKWDQFSADEYWQFSDAWIGEARRVLSAKGSLYVSCSMHNIGEVILLSKKHGFLLKNVITWHKPNAMPNISKRTFQHTTEYVCWFVSGSGWVFNYMDLKKINTEKTKEGKQKQMRDFIALPIVQGKERLRKKDGRAVHASQKPERLLEILITASTKPGDLVLDPFLGAGTTITVAQKMKRKWIGIEKNPDFVKCSRHRLRGIK